MDAGLRSWGFDTSLDSKVLAGYLLRKVTNLQDRADLLFNDWIDILEYVDAHFRFPKEDFYNIDKQYRERLTAQRSKARYCVRVIQSIGWSGADFLFRCSLRLREILAYPADMQVWYKGRLW